MVFAGVDEVGRGALAGPVTVAAVILPNDFENEAGIKDSKLLSFQKRVYLSEYIKDKAVAFSIHSISVEVIDEINILQATMLGMQQALELLTVQPTKVLIDGNYSTIKGYNVSTQVKADTFNTSVAAASILAKVFRDNLMMESLHLQYPQYHWKQNKGYATLEHRQAIMQHNISPHHRKTFCKNILQQLENERLF